MEIMVWDEPNKPMMPGQLNLNAPDNPDNTSEMIFFIHSRVNDIRISGAGSSEKHITVYAPNTVIERKGFGSAEYERAVISGSFSPPGNDPTNPWREGTPVNLNLGASTDTITHLQVTENEVFVE